MIVLATLALTACDDELKPVIPDEPSLYEEGYISIDIVAAKAPTRGVNDEPGVDDLNENKINNVVLCLWPQTGDRPDTEAPYLFKQYRNLNATGNVTLRVPLTETVRSQLFEGEGDGTKCLAYVAVNVDPAKAKTVAELRNLVVSSSFASSQRQSYFTMDGDGIVTLSPNKKAATGTVGAKRSACKITL